MHDTTTARVEGIDALLDAHPRVKTLVDAGYQGFAKEHPEQVSAPCQRFPKFGSGPLFVQR